MWGFSGRSKFTFLFVVLIFIGFSAGINHLNSGEPSPEELFNKAQDYLDSKNWEEAWKIYDTLLDKYNKTIFVSSRKDGILKGKAECEKNLNMVLDLSAVFKGKAELLAKNLRKELKIQYDFENANQCEDFDANAAEMKVENGKLVVESQNEIAFFYVKSISFSEKVSVEGKIIFKSDSREKAGFLVFFSGEPAQGYLFCGRYREFSNVEEVQNAITKITDNGGGAIKIDTVKQKLKPEIKTDVQYLFKAEVNGNKLKFYIDNKLVCEGVCKDFSKGSAGVFTSADKIILDDLKIDGYVDDESLKKLSSESALVKNSEDDLKNARDSRQVITLEPLSAESGEALKNVSNDSINSLSGARKRKNEIIEANDTVNYNENMKKLLVTYNDIIKRDPEFAAAYFDRSRIHCDLDSFDAALEDLDKAIKILPGFYEAYSEKSNILKECGKFEQALECADKALEINPKYSNGYSERAFIRFLMSNYSDAEKDLTKALELNKENEQALDLQLVIAGPKWAVLFQKETARFVVRTDISQAKCDSYAEALETILDYYCQTFPLEGEQFRKSRVYIFSTRKGFEIHAAITTGKDKDLSNTLGYYSPNYRELYLFEEVNQEEKTRRVLYHEGFHQYIHNAMPETPPWFNEGCAEWFNGTTLKGKRIVSKGEIIPGFANLKAEFNSRKPLKTLMSYSQEEFMALNPQLNYTQSWSFIYFCFTYESGKYKDCLLNYYKALKENKTHEEAFNASFGTMKFPYMEKEWADYILKLK